MACGRSACSEGTGILGVGGGLKGSTVCTELDFMMHVSEVTWGVELALTGTETRFRLWLASISAAVDAQSFSFI